MAILYHFAMFLNCNQTKALKWKNVQSMQDLKKLKKSAWILWSFLQAGIFTAASLSSWEQWGDSVGAEGRIAHFWHENLKILKILIRFLILNIPLGFQRFWWFSRGSRDPGKSPQIPH